MSSVKALKSKAPTYFIERMCEHDLLEIVAIEESCGLSLWGWDGYRSELERSESVMLVARLPQPDVETGMRIIGFVAARASAEEFHINNIGVREQARGFGVASTLLREALELGLLYGTRRAVLEVRSSNLAAQSLYQRHGFKIAGRRRSYYKNPPEDAHVMTAELID